MAGKVASPSETLTACAAGIRLDRSLLLLLLLLLLMLMLVLLLMLLLW